MEKVKVLLAGIGGYGAGYLNEFLADESCRPELFWAADGSFELAGVADPFAAASPRIEDLKARSIPVFQSPAEFFAEKRADLAVISSPIHTHYPYILTCFENGSNVLCEKPVTASLAELDELIAQEKKTGLFAAVGFQLCFARDVLALKRDILDGIFGRPLEFKALRFARRGTKYYRRNGWAGKLCFEGCTILDSPLQNACSHDIQIMLFLLGEDMKQSASVESVEAELWQGRPDIENYDAVALRLKTGNGTRLHFYTAHCVEESTAVPLGEYRFEKALVRWGGTPDAGLTACFDNGTIKSYSGISQEKRFQKLYDTVEAVRSGIPPFCTLETVRSHLHCVNLVQQFPVKKVPVEKLTQVNADDGEAFFYVPGLRDAFARAYVMNALPSEIGFV
jgi:predicted dehydrogenase